MPELPEVETTLRKIEHNTVGQVIQSVDVFRRDLRWSISGEIPVCLINKRCVNLFRRAKYLLFEFTDGVLLVHLGMSGSLRWLKTSDSYRRHDHVVFHFPKGRLAYHDPRRFGCILWHNGDDVHAHRLIKSLGVEPLTNAFNGEWLYAKTRLSHVPAKVWLMNHKYVVGVGNIYANEALFHARVSPFKAVNMLSRKQCHAIIKHVKKVLTSAILSGGSTLRDYVAGENEVGHFQLKCMVYGRAKSPCLVCGNNLKGLSFRGRQTVYCNKCQNVIEKVE